jgi:DHA1 family bicyclomycin/chloramphenicol resistance-like MFS transporter
VRVRSRTGRGRRARERLLPLRLVLVLGSLTAVGPLSLTLYLPALPQLAADLDSSDATAQLTVSACMVGLAAGQLLSGPVSDRFGRRLPLLTGIGAYAVSSLLCALAPDMRLLLVLRLLQGVAGGACIVIARTIVRDLFETDTVARVFALLMLVTGVAPVAAPVLGGQLVRLTSWPGLFVALGGIGCLIFVAAAWNIDETLPRGARSTSGVRVLGSQFGAVLRDPGFVGFTGILALATTILLTHLSMSPFVLQGQYGMSAQTFSYVFAATAVAMVIVGQFGGWLVGRRGAARTLRAGLTVTLLANGALLVAVVLGLSLAVLLPLLSLAVCGVSMILPNSNALALDAHRSRAGTASGVMGLAQFGVSGALVPLVASVGTTALVMSSTMVTAAALAVPLERLLARRRARPQPAPAVVQPAVPDAATR